MRYTLKVMAIVVCVIAIYGGMAHAADFTATFNTQRRGAPTRVVLGNTGSPRTPFGYNRPDFGNRAGVLAIEQIGQGRNFGLPESLRLPPSLITANAPRQNITANGNDARQTAFSAGRDGARPMQYRLGRAFEVVKGWVDGTRNSNRDIYGQVGHGAVDGAYAVEVGGGLPQAAPATLRKSGSLAKPRLLPRLALPLMAFLPNAAHAAAGYVSQENYSGLSPLEEGCLWIMLGSLVVFPALKITADFFLRRFLKSVNYNKILAWLCGLGFGGGLLILIASQMITFLSQLPID